MKLLPYTLLAVFLFPAWPVWASETNAQGHATVIEVVGAAGEEEFGEEFVKSAHLWQEAAEKAGATNVAIGLGPTNVTTDLSLLQNALTEEPKESSQELCWAFGSLFILLNRARRQAQDWSPS